MTARLKIVVLKPGSALKAPEPYTNLNSLEPSSAPPPPPQHPELYSRETLHAKLKVRLADFRKLESARCLQSVCRL